MMHDSFDHLRQVLNEAAGNTDHTYAQDNQQQTEQGKVIPFRRAQ